MNNSTLASSPNISSELLPMQFEKTTEVLPFTSYGLSSIEEFKKEESKMKKIGTLKKAGLSQEDIQLYLQNEDGILLENKKIESSVLKFKLELIYRKIKDFQNVSESSTHQIDKPSTSKSETVNKFEKNGLTFYPPGHPMNNLKELEDSMFGHLTDVMPLTKRRKILRRLERKKERILSQNKLDVTINNSTISESPRPGSLWDLKEAPVKVKQKEVIGPKKRTMYTIKDNKIVRLEPVNTEREEFEPVEIVVPMNHAEEQLLEGTKMCVDDIRKMERFKDYEPGIPSKVLYLKNIAPSVAQDRINMLFNQFTLENGGPVDVRLLSGRMRGQAFVTFSTEELAIRALEDINGTILSGKPIIAQFGRNTNRIQDNT